jgi:hypothetical protein
MSVDSSGVLGRPERELKSPTATHGEMIRKLPEDSDEGDPWLDETDRRVGDRRAGRVRPERIATLRAKDLRGRRTRGR